MKKTGEPGSRRTGEPEGEPENRRAGEPEGEPVIGLAEQLVYRLTGSPAHPLHIQ